MAQRHQQVLFQILPLLVITPVIKCHPRLNIPYYPNPYHFRSVSVLFSTRSFTEFYSCLCKSTTAFCEVYIGDLGSDTYSAERTNPTETSNPYVWSNIFQCEHKPYENLINCTRLDQINSISSQGRETTEFSLVGAMSCDFDCVGLLWKVARVESLEYDSDTDNIKQCIAKDEQARKSIGTNSESDMNSESDTTMTLIVGSVLGILLISFMIITGILLWKLRRQKSRKDTQCTLASPKAASRTSPREKKNTSSGDVKNANSANVQSKTSEEDVDKTNYVNVQMKTKGKKREKTKGTNPAALEMRSENDIEDMIYENDENSEPSSNRTGQTGYSDLGSERSTSGHNYTGLTSDARSNAATSKNAVTQANSNTYEDIDME